ncbi:hypothetical protein DPMN_022314 [Dreissena polymorpha]|uniref:Uncharacterized protein n=1 Tax=Dreissena polymorpha TaxID=45954 RepID=A0A9D4SCD5_DREPO|nr:hypothetical protein DPMN_022314 [Dreissena polymorpha]
MARTAQTNIEKGRNKTLHESGSRKTRLNTYPVLRVIRGDLETASIDRTPDFINVRRTPKKALANSVDPDETPHDAAFHLGLRCFLKKFLMSLLVVPSDQQMLPPGGQANHNLVC